MQYRSHRPLLSPIRYSSSASPIPVVSSSECYSPARACSALAGAKRKFSIVADPFREFRGDYPETRTHSSAQELVYQPNPYHDLQHSASTGYSFSMRDSHQLAFPPQQQRHGAAAAMPLSQPQPSPHTFHHNTFLDSHQTTTQSPISSYNSTPLHLDSQLSTKRSQSEGHDDDRISERPNSMSSFTTQAPAQTPQQHHHHHLPAQTVMHTQSSGDDGSSTVISTGISAVAGQEGMSDPTPRPKVSKLKFTPEEDALLVELKEQKNLTWKQIADFFPGRTSGTLQVRYCTKLKVKKTTWTEEMVQRLHHAMSEYENDRWRVIASKVGHGFSPAACREKAMELNPDTWQEDNELSG